MSNDVSRETEERLHAFQALVKKWNPRINLVSSSTLSVFWDRHIVDSLQISQHILPKGGKWVDLGSGGGFPGIVLAVVFADQDLDFILVESDQRKATFLRTAIRELSLDKVKVICDRIENVPPLQANHVSARALAPLSLLLSFVDRHMSRDGTAWLLKGENWQREVQEAQSDWAFNLESFPSMTSSEAALLKVSEVSHV